MARLNFKGVTMKPAVSGSGNILWLIFVVAVLVFIVGFFKSSGEPPKPQKPPKPLPNEDVSQLDWRNLR